MSSSDRHTGDRPHRARLDRVATASAAVVAALVLVLGSCSKSSKSPTAPPPPAPQALACQIVAAEPDTGYAPVDVTFQCLAGGGTPPYAHRWYFGDEFVAIGDRPSHTYHRTGLHTVRLVVTDAQSDSVSDSTRVFVRATEALVCDVTASPSAGPAPLTVTFGSTTGGGLAPYSHLWTFGDGGSATVPGPSHTYTQDGSYTARLVVRDARGDSLVRTRAISVAPDAPLTCTASASVYAGNAPLVVEFTATATGGRSPITASWEFGDGGRATGFRRVAHTYTREGVFTVKCTVADARGVSCVRRFSIAVADGDLTCTPSVAPDSGRAPLTVTFTGRASGGAAPYHYAWAFGDGDTAFVISPTHTYRTPGTYRAAFGAIDSRGQSCARSFTIEVTGPLACAASAVPTGGIAPLTVQFSASAGGGTAPYTYTWTFGDGAGATGASPAHTYAAAGTYSAVLTVRDAKGASCGRTISVPVTAPASLQCAASVDPASGGAPLTVRFVASATGGRSPYRFAWDFGNGGTSTNASATSTYAAAGIYSARLDVTDADGTKCSRDFSIRVAAAAPLACAAQVTPTAGNPPLMVRFIGSASGGAGGYTYAWAFGDGASGSGADLTHTYTAAGAYTARLTVRDAQSTVCTRDVVVTVRAPQPKSVRIVNDLANAGAFATYNQIITVRLGSTLESVAQWSSTTEQLYKGETIPSLADAVTIPPLYRQVTAGNSEEFSTAAFGSEYHVFLGCGFWDFPIEIFSFLVRHPTLAVCCDCVNSCEKWVIVRVYEHVEGVEEIRLSSFLPDANYCSTPFCSGTTTATTTAGSARAEVARSPVLSR